MKSEFNVKNKVKKIRERVDIRLLAVVLSILFLGTVTVFSASYPYAQSRYDDGYYYLKRQIIFLTVGLITMWVMSRVPTQFYRKTTPAIYGVCIILLVLVLVGGFSEGVAKRWLGIPGTPLSFQPSEIMKLGVILALSWWFDRCDSRKSTMKNEIIIPGVLLFGACGLVMLEKHLSGTVIIALIGLAIMFISGASIKKMLLAYGVTGLAGGVAFLLTDDYAMKRIESFLNPNADILDEKWQTTQGLFAIGSGGIWGRGLGNSFQKYSYVSEPQNDFIFTIWCEEMGYIGAILLIFLYLLLIIRGYKTAMRCEDKFSS